MTIESGRNAGRWRKGQPLINPVISRTRNAASRPVSGSRPNAAETLRVILASLEEMKAEDIVTIDLTGKTAFADAMVVASGRSNRHVGSIADSVTEELNKAGVKGIRTEGQPHCDWVLLDAGDVIIHIFRPEVRAFYGLEKMWSDGHKAAKPAG